MIRFKFSLSYWDNDNWVDVTDYVLKWQWEYDILTKRTKFFITLDNNCTFPFDVEYRIRKDDEIGYYNLCGYITNFQKHYWKFELLEKFKSSHDFIELDGIKVERRTIEQLDQVYGNK